MSWIRRTSLILLAVGMALPLVSKGAPQGGPPEPPDRGGPPDDPAGRGGPEADRGGRGPAGEPTGAGPLLEIRKALVVSDDEWKVLLPKIQAVQTAQKEVEHGARGGRGPARGGPDRGAPDREGPDHGAASVPATTPLQVAQTGLQNALAKQETTVAEYQSAMAAVRTARQKAAEALTKAQNVLIPLLTVRQEAVLVQLGIL